MKALFFPALRSLPPSLAWFGTSRVLAFALAAVSPVAAAEPGWIPLGPEAGQEVRSLAVLPGGSEPVLAGASSGVFRTDDGTRWDLLNDEELDLGVTGVLHAGSVPEGPVYLVVGAGANGAVYLRPEGPPEPEGGFDAIFRSTDGGESWRSVKESSGPFAVAPLDPSRLYLATRDGIERSLDGGETWTPATPGPILDLLDRYEVIVADITFAPSDPDTVYIFLRLPGDHGFPDEFLVVRSRNGARSWKVLEGPELRRAVAHDLVIDPADPDTVYLVLSGGVFRSRDGGITWEPRVEGLPFDSSSGGRDTTYYVEELLVDPEEPEILYAAIGRFEGVLGGVYRSTDAGASWAPAHEGLPLPLKVYDLAFDPSDSRSLYAATPAGVFGSTDRGGHWNPTPRKLPTPAASVAIDPKAPATLLTGTGDGRLFVSDDGGERWRLTALEIPSVLPSAIHVLTIAPGDPSILFAHGPGHRVTARSIDGGLTWELLASPGFGDVVELLVDPRDPKRVLASVGQAGGVFLSTDLGDRWTQILEGRVGHLVQAPSNPDVLYAGAPIGVPGPPRPEGVCLSADGGGSWECSVAGLMDGHGVSALAVDPRDSSVVLAALAKGGQNQKPFETSIRRSVDGGATWVPTGPGLPLGVSTSELAFDPWDPEVLWAATPQGGVFRSADGGGSWTPSNRGLTHHRVRDLDFDASGRVLLAATETGVFRFSATGGPAPPPEIGWIEDAALSGFRVKVRIARGGGQTIPGTKEPACIPETVCVSGALPGRSELFVRIVGPKPNGWLWPTLVKFSTSRIEVWLQQLSTGELRYYELRGASPGFDELPGLFDRFGFLPD